MGLPEFSGAGILIPCAQTWNTELQGDVPHMIFGRIFLQRSLIPCSQNTAVHGMPLYVESM